MPESSDSHMEAVATVVGDIGDLLSERHALEKSNNRLEQTSLACMFCFPISDHVMLLEGIVPFKCRLMHVQMYAQLMKKQKENSHEGTTWSEMGKQNVQAKEVYSPSPPRMKLFGKNPR